MGRKKKVMNAAEMEQWLISKGATPVSEERGDLESPGWLGAWGAGRGGRGEGYVNLETKEGTGVGGQDAGGGFSAQRQQVAGQK